MAKQSLYSYLTDIETAMAQGKAESAVIHCQHIISQYPEHVKTHKVLGKALYESGQQDEAIDVLQYVVAADPEDSDSHITLANAYQGKGMLHQAILHTERAFELNPYDSDVQVSLKSLYGQRDGTPPERIPLTRGALARLYFRGKLYQQAIAEVRRSLAEDPDRLDLQLLLAETLWSDGKHGESADLCSDILRKSSSSIKATAILAAIGNADGATQYRDKLTKLILPDRTQMGNDLVIDNVFEAYLDQDYRVEVDRSAHALLSADDQALAETPDPIIATPADTFVDSDEQQEIEQLLGQTEPVDFHEGVVAQLTEPELILEPEVDPIAEADSGTDIDIDTPEQQEDTTVEELDAVVEAEPEIELEVEPEIELEVESEVEPVEASIDEPEIIESEAATSDEEINDKWLKDLNISVEEDDGDVTDESADEILDWLRGAVDDESAVGTGAAIAGTAAIAAGVLNNKPETPEEVVDKLLGDDVPDWLDDLSGDKIQDDLIDQLEAAEKAKAELAANAKTIDMQATQPSIQLEADPVAEPIVPAEPVADAIVDAPVEEPVEIVAEAEEIIVPEPAEPVADAIVDAPVEEPVEIVAETEDIIVPEPAEPVADAIVDAPVEEPVEIVAEAEEIIVPEPAEPVADAIVDAPVVEPVEIVAEAEDIVVPEPVLPAEPVADVIADMPVEAIVEPSLEEPAIPVVEPQATVQAMDLVNEDKPVVEQVAEAVSEPPESQELARAKVVEDQLSAERQVLGMKEPASEKVVETAESATHDPLAAARQALGIQATEPSVDTVSEDLADPLAAARKKMGMSESQVPVVEEPALVEPDIVAAQPTVAVMGLVPDGKKAEADKPTSVEPKVVEPQPTVAVMPTIPKAPVVDDLTKIEGVGPKIASVLNSNDITNFSQLADADAEQLTSILRAAGSQYNRYDPTSWPKQASFAASGEWDMLKAMQDQLDGGKYVIDAIEEAETESDEAEEALIVVSAADDSVDAVVEEEELIVVSAEKETEEAPSAAETEAVADDGDSIEDILSWLEDYDKEDDTLGNAVKVTGVAGAVAGVAALASAGKEAESEEAVISVDDVVADADEVVVADTAPEPEVEPETPSVISTKADDDVMSWLDELESDADAEKVDAVAEVSEPEVEPDPEIIEDVAAAQVTADPEPDSLSEEKDDVMSWLNELESDAETEEPISAEEIIEATTSKPDMETVEAAVVADPVQDVPAVAEVVVPEMEADAEPNVAETEDDVIAWLDELEQDAESDDVTEEELAEILKAQADEAVEPASVVGAVDSEPAADPQQEDDVVAWLNSLEQDAEKEKLDIVDEVPDTAFVDIEAEELVAMPETADIISETPIIDDKVDALQETNSEEDDVLEWLNELEKDVEEDTAVVDILAETEIVDEVVSEPVVAALPVAPEPEADVLQWLNELEEDAAEEAADAIEPVAELVPDVVIEAPVVEAVPSEPEEEDVLAWLNQLEEDSGSELELDDAPIASLTDDTSEIVVESEDDVLGWLDDDAVAPAAKPVNEVNDLSWLEQIAGNGAESPAESMPVIGSVEDKTKVDMDVTDASSISSVSAHDVMAADALTQAAMVLPDGTPGPTQKVPQSEKVEQQAKQVVERKASDVSVDLFGQEESVLEQELSWIDQLALQPIRVGLGSKIDSSLAEAVTQTEMKVPERRDAVQTAVNPITATTVLDAPAPAGEEDMEEAMAWLETTSTEGDDGFPFEVNQVIVDEPLTPPMPHKLIEPEPSASRVETFDEMPEDPDEIVAWIENQANENGSNAVTVSDEIKAMAQQVAARLFGDARGQLRDGDMAGAAKTYGNILAQDKGNASLIVGELESAVKSNGNQPLLYRVLGDAYKQTGQLSKSLHAYNKAMDLMA